MSGGPIFPGTTISSTTTPEGLASLLGTSYRKIKHFYYKGNIRNHYSIFTIPKKSGGLRTIFSPSEQLKTLQSRIAFQLSTMYTPRKVVKAFVEGGSITANAAPHVKKQFVFNLDLQDFFPQ